MPRLSIAGLVLAGTYAALSSAALGCSFLGCLGRDPTCMCAFCDPHFGLTLLPLLPALLALQLVGLTSLSLFPTASRYFPAIFATIIALYGLGWLLGRTAAALRRR